MGEHHKFTRSTSDGCMSPAYLRCSAFTMHLGRDSSVGDAGSAVVGCILFQINVDGVFIFKLMLTVCLFLTSVIKLNPKITTTASVALSTYRLMKNNASLAQA